MGFQPEVYQSDAKPVLRGTGEGEWRPLYFHKCSFTPEIFFQVMQNLIRNPNLNSNHLFRADILLEVPYHPALVADPVPRIIAMNDFNLNVSKPTCSR
jgi:tRNASer (uridine44-2'-O)-methyltransferase